MCWSTQMDSLSKWFFVVSGTFLATSASASVLPYSFYDDLRQSSTATFTPLVGGGDSSGQQQHVGRNLHAVSGDAGVGELTLCHVPTFFRWSQASSDAPGGYNDVSSEAYGGTSAALLAMHHFNTGDGKIAPDLKGINERCPIRLTMETIDSTSSGIKAVQELTSLVTRSPTDAQIPQPCAVVGSSWSGTTKKMATVSGVYDLLQVTPSASSVSLDNKGEYPLFTRTHPSDASMAELSVDYLHNVLGVKFFGQLYLDNDFGSSYHTAVLNRAAQYDMVVKSVPFRPSAEDDEIMDALLELNETGYNYFLGIFFRGDYERIMGMAGEIGVAGPGSFWMFNGALSSAFVNGQTSLEAESDVAKATFGTAIIHDEGGLPGLPRFDKFLKEWRDIPNNPELLAYINSKQPLPPAGSGLNFERDGEFFLQTPSHIAAFSYDAIVGLGLSACQALEAKQESDIFTGAQHHSVFINTEFKGASGDVLVDPEISYSRTAESTLHAISNILPIGGADATTSDEDGMISFKATPTSFYDVKKLKWKRYGDEDNVFVFPDGTTVPPPEIPEVEHNYNRLGPGVRGACLTLSAIAIVMSIGFMTFTFMQREAKVIKAAQPHFLIMLCVGCLLMAATIIPASMDDATASTKGCNVACMSKVWLFACGFCVCFSALFSKLYRITKLFKNAKGFKRITVTMKDVLAPFFVLITANIIVLTTWTAYSPLRWTRTVLEYDDYGRPVSSLGQCSSSNGAPFIWVLVVINGCALVLALWQAYLARNITTEFSESNYIAMAMVMIFQSLFIGVPIMVIVSGQPAPQLFVLSAIVFIIVVAMLLLIFLPKIHIMRQGDEGLPQNYNPRGSTWMRNSAVMLGSSSRNVQESCRGISGLGSQASMRGSALIRDPSKREAWGSSLTSSKEESIGPDNVTRATSRVSFKLDDSRNSMEKDLANYGNSSVELPTCDENDEEEKAVDASTSCDENDEEEKAADASTSCDENDVEEKSAGASDPAEENDEEEKAAGASDPAEEKKTGDEEEA